MTLKQIRFIYEYIETGGNATISALNAYNCKNRNVAGVIGYQNLRKLNIKQEIDKVLDMAGYSSEMVAKKLKQEMSGINSFRTLKLLCKIRGFI